MKAAVSIVLLLFPFYSFADIYDDFVEDHIISSAREKLIKRYEAQEIPDGYHETQWNKITKELISKVNADLGKGAPVFSRVSDEYRKSFTPEDMAILVEIVSNPSYQEIMKKNRSVKSNVIDAIQDYVLEDLMAAAQELRSQN